MPICGADTSAGLGTNTTCARTLARSPSAGPCTTARIDRQEIHGRGVPFREWRHSPPKHAIRLPELCSGERLSRSDPRHMADRLFSCSSAWNNAFGASSLAGTRARAHPHYAQAAARLPHEGDRVLPGRPDFSCPPCSGDVAFGPSLCRRRMKTTTVFIGRAGPSKAQCHCMPSACGMLQR